MGVKPDKTTDEEWKVMEQKSVSAIQPYLSNKVKHQFNYDKLTHSSNQTTYNI
jgi:hypothetical protein